MDSCCEWVMHSIGFMHESRLIRPLRPKGSGDADTPRIPSPNAIGRDRRSSRPWQWRAIVGVSPTWSWEGTSRLLRPSRKCLREYREQSPFFYRCHQVSTE